MGKQMKLGLAESGITPWVWAAVKGGKNAARLGMPVAAFGGEAESRARAYMKRAIKRHGISQAEGAKRAIEYRYWFLTWAYTTACVQAMQAGDPVLEAEVWAYSLSPNTRA